MWHTWTADVLRSAGLRVFEHIEWRTAGRAEAGEALGVCVHHTVGAPTGIFPSRDLLVRGYPGLPGPLCNLAVDREGAWHVIAAGRANHAGSGAASFVPAGRGNTHLLGVEMESAGRGDDWTPAQLDAAPQGVAALLGDLGLGSYRCIGHREWAPVRKPVCPDWPGGMTAFRDAVARSMGDDDLFTHQDRALLREVRDALLELRPHRVDYAYLRSQGIPVPDETDVERGRDTTVGYAVSADARAFETRQTVELILGELRALAGRVGDPHPGGDGEMRRLAAVFADELVRRLISPPA